MAIKKVSSGLSLGVLRKVKGGYKFRVGKRASGILYPSKESALESEKKFKKMTRKWLN
eukprot:COSAG05_NODE_351_length_10910_cov_25.021645_1_plen_57_part_10